MENHDPIITALCEEKILDEQTLQTAIGRQQKTGQSIISILKEENLLDENQLTRAIAAANKIDFIDLSP